MSAYPAADGRLVGYQLAPAAQQTRKNRRKTGSPERVTGISRVSAYRVLVLLRAAKHQSYQGY